MAKATHQTMTIPDHSAYIDPNLLSQAKEDVRLLTEYPIKGVKVKAINVSSVSREIHLEIHSSSHSLHQGQLYQVCFKFPLDFPATVQFCEPIPPSAFIYSNGDVYLDVIDQEPYPGIIRDAAYHLITLLKEPINSTRPENDAEYCKNAESFQGNVQIYGTKKKPISIQRLQILQKILILFTIFLGILSFFLISRDLRDQNYRSLQNGTARKQYFSDLYLFLGTLVFVLLLSTSLLSKLAKMLIQFICEIIDLA